ncbi:hypothetical protein Pcinc_027443 [Petrolisthes cinctipes]|uniref:Uncharacterized protein n=1 Tax=Petrolisthes cinctipes TaxID=88211 RepID=A0AAE1K6U1_PETCI|nr:hypothetical protein Pcinc_027443 [Petrolisthes cinctipes]
MKEDREDDEERENNEDRKGREDDDDKRKGRENMTEGTETRKTCLRSVHTTDRCEVRMAAWAWEQTS